MINIEEWEVIYRNQKEVCYWQITEKILAAIMQRVGKIDTVLDVGCGKGYLVSRLRKMGYAADGVDISFAAVRSSRKLFGAGFIKQLDIEKEDIGQYDLIFCNMVLGFISFKKALLSKLLSKSKVLVISQVILIDGTKYGKHAMRIGIWQQEFIQILKEMDVVWEIIFSEVDEFGALRQVYFIQRG